MVWKVEQRRGGAQGVTWKANSMFQVLAGIQPKKAPKNAANVRFCIPFDKLFRVAVTQGKCMREKKVSDRKGVEREKKNQGAHFIDLFFSVWTKERGRKKQQQGSHLYCRLHCQRAINPFFPRQDSWHFCTFEGREIQVWAPVLEQWKINTVPVMTGVGNRCTEEKW